MRRIVLAVTAAAVWGTVGVAVGDVLRLKDGTSIEGDVKKADGGGWVVTMSDGQVATVPAERVKAIEAVPKKGSAAGDAAAAGLASLRRASDNQPDVKQIIDNYDRFIGQYAGTPAAEEARHDRAEWQTRLDKDLVRVGKKWVTRDERGRLELESLQLADRARQQIKDGQWRDAEASIAAALESDPTSAAALYLRALAEYQAGQFVPARKDLELVKAATPNHGPTLNNLGVIAVRQNRLGEAVSYFDQAMRAAPGDRTIVDNAAEVLHALTEESSRTTVQKSLLQRTAATFHDQDAKLATKLKEQGLNRWGATWVSDADMTKLQEAQKRIEEKTNALQAEFDATQRQIVSIDDRIAANDATLRRLESDSYRWDVNGVMVQVPLPPVYYDVQRDTQTQRVARQQAVAKLEGIRQQARTVDRELPIPKYAGTLQMVGPDGAPVVMASAKPVDGKDEKGEAAPPNAQQ